MEKRDILLSLIQHYTHGNKAAFARLIGITPNGLSTWISRNSFDTDKIIANCECVNPTYLLTGKGTIILNEEGDSTESVSENKDNHTLNEILAICTTLAQQMRENIEIMKKSQELFERVLDMHDNKNKKTIQFYDQIVSEPNLQK